MVAGVLAQSLVRLSPATHNPRHEERSPADGAQMRALRLLAKRDALTKRLALAGLRRAPALCPRLGYSITVTHGVLQRPEGSQYVLVSILVV